jgi:hypothetical protein
MSTISEKIKQALASIEAVRKDLNAVDEDHAELAALRGIVDARKAELADVEARLARAQDEFAKADADHARWREVSTKEQVKTNTQIDLAHERLRVLEGQVVERQREHDAIVDSMAALGKRLRVG